MLFQVLDCSDVRETERAAAFQNKSDPWTSMRQRRRLGHGHGNQQKDDRAMKNSHSGTRYLFPSVDEFSHPRESKEDGLLSKILLPIHRLEPIGASLVEPAVVCARCYPGVEKVDEVHIAAADREGCR
jgi:hypothetical protein